MRTYRPRGDNGPSQFAEEDAPTKKKRVGDTIRSVRTDEDRLIGRTYYCAVNRVGMLKGPLFTNAAVCAETTCPGHGLVYEVRIVAKEKWPPSACMKL